MKSLLAQATQKFVGTIARRAQATMFCETGGAARLAIMSRPCSTFVTTANTFRRRLPMALFYSKGKGVVSSLGQYQQQQQQRFLETEAEFHPIADETLETIQDAMDAVFDGQPQIEYEVTLTNGVLNLTLPPHGTWVINKQTPNRQIWVRDKCTVLNMNGAMFSFQKKHTHLCTVEPFFIWHCFFWHYCSGQAHSPVQSASSTTTMTSCGFLPKMV